MGDEQIEQQIEQEAPSVSALGQVSAWLEEHDPEGEGDDLQEEIVSDEEPEEQDAEPVVSEEGDTPEPSDDEEAPDELESAFGILQKDGWKISMLKKLGRDEILTMSRRAAKRQSEIQQKFDTFSAELGKLKGGKNESAESGEEAVSVESPAQTPANLDAAVKAFAEHLGLESKEAEPLISTLAQAVSAPIKKDLDEARSLLRLQGEVLTRITMQSARESLKGDFPDLSSSDSFEAVGKKMQGLDPQAYSDIPDFGDRVKAMMADAATLVFKNDIAKNAVRKASSVRRHKGQITAPSRAKTETVPADPFAAAQRTLDQLERKYGQSGE